VVVYYPESSSQRRQVVMIGFSRMTPWVGRLIIANAVVHLLRLTVFTAPGVVESLAFDPAGGLARPWTFLSYMFIHHDLVHLAVNMLGLYVFGTAVEQRLTSRVFLPFYLFCGVGAALLTLLVAPMLPIAPFIGASGAVMGVSIVFALLWPDAEMVVFPIPVPMKARTLAIGLVAFNFAMLVLEHMRAFGVGGVAYEAHLGGALMGYLFFRVQTVSRRAPREVVRPVERGVVMAPSATLPADRTTAAAPARSTRRRAEADPVSAEMDRVLDKISAEGMQSLTQQERQFLDEVARQKRKPD
jgi:membrane associated rhomboid family serine protease